MTADHLRERRIAETTARLTTTARRWAAERGLAGFTVDELCQEEVLARRTFFDHFATKEDAVLGVKVRDPLEPQTQALGPAGAPGANGLSASLIDDLSRVLITRCERLDLSAADLAALIAAIDREPRLLARARQLARVQSRSDAALVELRDHLSPGDPRASTVVQVLGVVLRDAMREVVASGGERAAPHSLRAPPHHGSAGAHPLTDQAAPKCHGAHCPR